jgi:redox-sensing transcriptional repressor
VGYYVQDLISSIKQSLGVNRVWKTALVGVGNLGWALLNHREFRVRGFHIVGAFDCDPFKIGEVVSGLEVICSRRLSEKVGELGIEIGIVDHPPERASLPNYQVQAGSSLLNFAPARITVPATCPYSTWTSSTPYTWPSRSPCAQLSKDDG